MMKKYTVILGILAVLAMTAAVAKADPGPYDAFFSTDPCDGTADATETPCETLGETNINDVVDYLLTNASVANPFATNVDLDAIQLGYAHAYWANLGGTGGLAFISISAGGFNTPGIYEQGFPGAPVFMATGGTGDMFFGDGTVVDPYPGLLNPFGASNFGVLVNHTGGSPGILYSDPGLNLNSFDQMLAFDLSAYLDGTSLWLDTDGDTVADTLVTLNNTFLLAFEDIPLGGANTNDHDFNDAVFLFTRVVPVPEPMSMALFGTGLLGMAGLRRGKKA